MAGHHNNIGGGMQHHVVVKAEERVETFVLVFLILLHVIYTACELCTLISSSRSVHK